MARTNIGNLPVVVAPITGSDVNVLAGDLIAASNMQFAFSVGSSFGLAAGATPVTGEYEVRFAQNAGSFTGFHAKVTTPGSSASVTVDLKVNGTSVLSSPITLTNATSAGIPQNGTISVPSFAANARVTVLLTVSSSTGMSGVSCVVNGVENGQPI